MSAVAVLLTALGMADLCRRAVAAAWVPLAVGPIVVAACAALVSLTVLSGWSSPVAGAISRWSAWAHLPLSHVPPTRALMVVGVVLVQFATANQLVRLVLGSVGAVRPAGQPQPSDRLKGGRLLGPMERLLILSLGVGGQLAAASAVVAAKGIIRFPELNAQKGQNGDVGIDEVTEYFLVGSFTSWLLALGGIGLVLATR